MESLINSFLESMQADGKSKRTLSAYRTDLNGLFKFFSGRSVGSIKYQDLRIWANSLQESGLSASTRARKIAAVKSFFRYLLKMEVVDRNPSDGLEAPKLEKKQPLVISKEQASELLYHARNDGGIELTWFRDYTVLAVFLFTGIRREELTNIKLEDIDMDRGTVLIHGKGGKQRSIYISDNLRPILSEYIMIHRKNLRRSETSWYLFPSYKSDHISAGTVNNIVNRFFKSSGFKRSGISAHILRKRFATSVFESTHDIATVSQILGHSSPTVTMRYVALSEDSMRSATNCVNF